MSERERLMMAVVEACRAWGLAAKYLPPAVYNALAALDTLPAPQPTGEVVEVRVGVSATVTLPLNTELKP